MLRQGVRAVGSGACQICNVGNAHFLGHGDVSDGSNATAQSSRGIAEALVRGVRGAAMIAHGATHAQSLMPEQLEGIRSNHVQEAKTIRLRAPIGGGLRCQPPHLGDGFCALCVRYEAISRLRLQVLHIALGASKCRSKLC